MDQTEEKQTSIFQDGPKLTMIEKNRQDRQEKKDRQDRRSRFRNEFRKLFISRCCEQRNVIVLGIFYGGKIFLYIWMTKG